MLDAVRNGKISVDRINESVQRVLSLKLKRGLFKNPYVDEDEVPAKVGTSKSLATADEITNKTVTLVKKRRRRASRAGELLSGRARHRMGSVDDSNSLAGSIAQRGTTTEVYETGTNPTEAQRQATVAKATSKDLVVVSTERAWNSTGQQELVEDPVVTGTPLVVLAVRDPYDIAYFTDAPTYLATYSYSPVSLQAAVRVLFGEVDPSGKLRWRFQRERPGHRALPVRARSVLRGLMTNR